MATHLTRSSRKPEGLTTRSSRSKKVLILPDDNQNAHNRQPPNIGRRKRSREHDDQEDQTLVTKKARIAIEITPRPKATPKTRSLVIKSNAESAVLPHLLPTSRPPPQSRPQPKDTRPEASRTRPRSASTQKTTEHQQKLANGITHELEQLQPNKAVLKETRKLRSQEGTRFKSDLSTYFPEYDEVIGNEPREERKSARIPGSTHSIAHLFQTF